MPKMTAPPNLVWRVDGPYEVASDRQQLFVRETLGSETLGTIAGLIFMAGAAFGGWKLFDGGALVAKGFGVLLMLFAAGVAVVALRQALGAVGVINAPTRRPLVIFDRGNSVTSQAAIQYGRRRVPVRNLRHLTTRPSSFHQRQEAHLYVVVAVLHDGTDDSLNINASAHWAAHYAQMGARWLGVSYQACRG